VINTAKVEIGSGHWSLASRGNWLNVASGLPSAGAEPDCRCRTSTTAGKHGPPIFGHEPILWNPSRSRAISVRAILVELTVAGRTTLVDATGKSAVMRTRTWHLTKVGVKAHHRLWRRPGAEIRSTRPFQLVDGRSWRGTLGARGAEPMWPKISSIGTCRQDRDWTDDYTQAEPWTRSTRVRSDACGVRAIRGSRGVLIQWNSVSEISMFEANRSVTKTRFRTVCGV